MPIRVAVSGAGKMGQEVLAAACREPDLEPVGVIARSVDQDHFPLPNSSGVIPCTTNPEELFSSTNPDVLIDFTNAEWTPFVVKAALDAGVRPVIGTSGLPEGFLEDLSLKCQELRIGAVVAANFAIGAALMIYLASLAGRFFDHAEIIEMHHDQKKDAPSATSIATAYSLAKKRKGPFQHSSVENGIQSGPRGIEVEGVRIHSIRTPGLIANQSVVLGGLGQILTISHDVVSRESFMPGVCLATREVMKRQDLALGLENLIDLGE